MLTTYYNDINSKQQKQLQNTLSSSQVNDVSARVSELNTFQLPTCIYTYFELNPNLLQKNTTATFLFGLDIPENKRISGIIGKGFDSEEMTHNISSIGYFEAIGSDIYFYLTGDFEPDVVFRTQLVIFLEDTNG